MGRVHGESSSVLLSTVGSRSSNPSIMKLVFLATILFAVYISAGVGSESEESSLNSYNQQNAVEAPNMRVVREAKKKNGAKKPNKGKRKERKGQEEICKERKEVSQKRKEGQ